VNLSFLAQAVYNRREEFFLFGSVMEATMIDRRYEVTVLDANMIDRRYEVTVLEAPQLTEGRRSS
jgi:hypothetical protein